MQETPTPQQTIPKIPEQTQTPDKNKQEHQTIWETLEYAKWNEAKQVWQCAKKECTKVRPVQKNLIKHCARVHKEHWRQLSRYAILCPYCDKKYSILTHLIIHLGIRENPYTWPTCTCPLKPDNTNIREIWRIIHGIAKQEKRNLIQAAQNNARQTMREKLKRHLVEDALLNEKAPTKRIKLVPKAGNTRARKMPQWPEPKWQKMNAKE